jgi:hypothetical protein
MNDRKRNPDEAIPAGRRKQDEIIQPAEARKKRPSAPDFSVFPRYLHIDFAASPPTFEFRDHVDAGAQVFELDDLFAPDELQLTWEMTKGLKDWLDRTSESERSRRASPNRSYRRH